MNQDNVYTARNSTRCARCAMNKERVEQRMALCQALGNYQFAEPDQQIVFESVRELLNRNALSKDALTVHLNNRGFPDINLERYFVAGAPSADDSLAGMREFLSRPV